MTSLRMAWAELRRITATRNARIVVVALMLIPAMYAGVYLYANHDPYANLKYVPAALVVQDTGHTDVSGNTVTAGRQVADELLASGSFDWHEVDRVAAEDGVRTGRYNFAMVIPKDFSASLTSVEQLEPEQARIQLITNDANSYLSTSIANTMSKQVLSSLSAQVSEAAAEKFLLGITDVRSGLVSAADGAQKLATGTGELVTGSGKAEKGAASLASGSAQLNAGMAELSSGITKLKAGAESAEAGAKKLAKGADKLSAGATRLSAGLSELEQATADLPAQTQELAIGARKVADGDAQVAAYGDAAAAAATRIVDRYATVRADLVTQMTGLGLTAEQQQALLAGYDKLEPAITDGNDKVQKAAGSLDQLAAGADQVADGNEKLAAATPDLVAGIAAAADGAQQLDSGAAALADGARKLSDGLGQLVAGVASASEGAAKLATGSADLQSGSEKLDAGLVQLAAGVGQAHDGATKLHDGLVSGAQEIPEVDAQTRKRISDTIANPVKLRSVSQASAGSYGAGLAPYFLSLAAWIGAYALFLLVRPLSRRALAANQGSIRIALGGWLPPALIGAGQMVIALSIVGFAVGIDLGDFAGTLLFMLLVSACFVAILHLLNSALGSTGQFLGLMLMVLQLVTAGGTFPWQTLPRPIAWLHNVLPMTHGVNGMRQLLYGGASPRLAADVAALTVVLVGALALTSLVARRQRVWTPKRLRPEVAV